MSNETKQMLLSLLEGIPDNIVLMKVMTGDDYTCKKIKENLEDENAKLFFSSLFRCSRDILIKQANKNDSKNSTHSK